MHFVRYADPDEHVRVRFRSHIEVDNLSLLTHMVSVTRGWVSPDLLVRTEFATYDREVERYGGVDAIGVAETIFTIDSLDVLSDLAPLRELTAQRHLHIARAARFLETLCGDDESALPWYAGCFGRRPRLDAESWLTVRKALDLIASLPAQEELVSAASLLRSVTLGRRRDNAIRALMHMHFNRIGLMGPHEQQAYADVAAALDGARHRRLATIRTQTSLVSKEGLR